MTLFELAEELRRRYENAKRNEVVLEIALFGIDHGEEIREKGYLIKDIVAQSGINQSYVTEVTKGVNLSHYVNRNTFEKRGDEMKNKLNLYRLKKAIVCSKITSYQSLCEQTGIDKRILLLALDGKTMLNINEYKELSRVLEVPFEWLVGISDDMEQEE